MSIDDRIRNALQDGADDIATDMPHVDDLVRRADRRALVRKAGAAVMALVLVGGAALAAFAWRSPSAPINILGSPDAQTTAGSTSVECPSPEEVLDPPIWAEEQLQDILFSHEALKALLEADQPPPGEPMHGTMHWVAPVIDSPLADVARGCGPAVAEASWWAGICQRYPASTCRDGDAEWAAQYLFVNRIDGWDVWYRDPDNVTDPTATPTPTASTDPDVACAQKPAASRSRASNGTMNVYFACVVEVHPLARPAPDTPGVEQSVRAAVQALAAGPNEQERERGYRGVIPQGDRHLETVTYEPDSGVVTVSFAPTIRDVNNLGTTGVTLPFLDGLTATVLQFDDIDTLRIEINGECWSPGPVGACEFDTMPSTTTGVGPPSSPCSDGRVLSADIDGDGQTDRVTSTIVDNRSRVTVCLASGRVEDIEAGAGGETLETVDVDRDGASLILTGGTSVSSVGVDVVTWFDGELTFVTAPDGDALRLEAGGFGEFDEQAGLWTQYREWGCADSDHDGVRNLVTSQARPGEDHWDVTLTGYRISEDNAQVVSHEQETRTPPADPFDILPDC